jgi:hypothetical protein
VSVVADALNDAATRSVDGFLAAWTETDAGRRLNLLEAACGEPVVFADRMGSATGRAAISDYIGAAQRFMPGARLERRGPVELVRDRGRFAWHAVAIDGRQIGAGVTYAEFAPNGLVQRLTGFWDDA